MANTITPLRRRGTYLLWLAGDTAQQLGLGLGSFAMPLLTLIVTGSPTVAGTVGAVQLVGGVVGFLPVACSPTGSIAESCVPGPLGSGSPCPSGWRGWLRWDHVHAAMLGNVEPPADDQRAPTSQERWAQEMERAAAVIREATGQPERIAAVDIPDGVVDAVSAAYDTPTPTQLRDAITRQERDATLIDGARNLLGTKPGERHVMRKVKELVEQEPDNHEREADLWSAYWLIRDWDAMGGDDGHEGHLAQLRKLLTHAEKQERAATEKEWPKAWPMGLMPVWLEYGGTVEAARAWASAGWPADHVLTSERLTDTWNPEFEERLTLTTPENRPRNP